MVPGCRPVVAAVLGLLLSASPALAQGEPGVTLDPGSPAAKEYALPIEQARRDARGGGKPSTAGTSADTAPSFGEGIRPAPESDATAPTREGEKSKSKSKAKTKPSSTVTPRDRAKAQDSIARALTAASVNRGDSSDGSLVLLLGGSAVMVLGVALGYLLRRRRQA